MHARRKNKPTRGRPGRRPPWTKPQGQGTRRPKRWRSGTRVAAASEATVGSLWRSAVEAAAPAVAEAGARERLNHFMARCGVAARRACDTLIAAGRVSIDGETVTELGRRIDPRRERVAVDGSVIAPERPQYFLLHKPRGVVCTNARNEQKPRAIDLVPGARVRLFPVGRLDAESEGLLLLTNDGTFADKLMHPRFGVPKVYHAVLRGRIDQESLGKARGGVWLAEGKTQGATVKVLRLTRERTHVEVRIREGRNREVRRIFARLGFPVLRLRRTRVGPLSLRGLGRGKSRPLSPFEVEALLLAASPGEA